MSWDAWQTNPQDARPPAPGLSAPVWGSQLGWDARTQANKRLIHVQVPEPRAWTLWLQYECDQSVPVRLRILQASGQSSTSRIVEFLPGQMPIMVVGQTVIVDAFGPGGATGLVPVPAVITCALTPGTATLLPLAGQSGQVTQILPAVAPGTPVAGDLGVTRLLNNLGPGTVDYEITPGTASGRIPAGTTINLPYTGPLVLVDSAGTGPTVIVTTIKA